MQVSGRRRPLWLGGEAGASRGRSFSQFPPKQRRAESRKSSSRFLAGYKGTAAPSNFEIPGREGPTQTPRLTIERPTAKVRFPTWGFGVPSVPSETQSSLFLPDRLGHLSLNPPSWGMPPNTAVFTTVTDHLQVRVSQAHVSQSSTTWMVLAYRAVVLKSGNFAVTTPFPASSRV